MNPLIKTFVWLGTLYFSSSTAGDISLLTCAEQAQLAESTMKARQEGISMAKMMEVIKKQPEKYKREKNLVSG